MNERKYGKILTADLHFHSWISHDYEKPGQNSVESIDDYVNSFGRAIDEGRIPDVCSITDHNKFSFDLYSKLKEKYTDRIFFPGIELNLSNPVELGDDNEEDSFHAVLIINPKHILKFIKAFEDLENIKCFAKLEDGKFEDVKIISDDRGTKHEYNNIKFNLEKIIMVLQKDCIDFLLIPHSNSKDRNIQKFFGKQLFLSEAGNILIKMNTSALDEMPKSVGEDKFSEIRGIIWNYYSSIILSSDNHNIDEYPKNQDGNINPKFGIDFDGTFEDLKFSLTDQYDRIFYGDEIEKYKSYIEDRIFLKEFELNGEKYNLSPELNVIIGEKGSGKSTLANLIANNNLSSGNKLRNKNSLTIDNFNREKIGMLKQSALYEINIDDHEAFEKKLKELGISTLIKFNESSLAAKFNREFSKLISEIEYIRRQMIDWKMPNDHDKIYNLIFSEQFTLDKKRWNSAYKDLRNNIDSNFRKMDYEKGYLIELSRNLEQFSSKIKSIIEIDFNNFLIEINIKKQLISHTNNNDMIRKKISDAILKYELKSAILNNMHKYLNEDDVTDEFDTSGFFEKIFEIRILFDKYQNWKKKIEDLYKEIDKNQDEFNDIKMNDHRKSEQMIFFAHRYSINETFDKAKEHDCAIYYLGVKVEFAETFMLNIWENSNLDFFLNWSRDMFSMSPRKKPSNAIDSEEKMMTLYKGDFRVVNDLSPGEKSKQYLEFILSKFVNKFSTIIIDQPEDNLDNDTINKSIVSFIRKTKKRYQYIVITHNSQIAIGSSANNVLITEIIDDKLNLVSGTLLSEDIYDRALRYLEGGKASLEDRFIKMNAPSKRADNITRLNEYLSNRWDQETLDEGLSNEEQDEIIRNREKNKWK